MARLNVNPTRMELRSLKERLKTAQRGHKLLKDKSDEMIRQFLDLARENRRVRLELGGQVQNALGDFALASATCDPVEVAQSLSMPTARAKIITDTANVMGVEVPKLKIERQGKVSLPYALSSVSGDLDNAVLTVSELTDKLLRLAELEKSCCLLANEIERTRRRVNALEYITIPQLQETIKYILMKLEENERSAIVRIMKVNSNAQKQS